MPWPRRRESRSGKSRRNGCYAAMSHVRALSLPSPYEQAKPLLAPGPRIQALALTKRHGLRPLRSYAPPCIPLSVPPAFPKVGGRVAGHYDLFAPVFPLRSPGAAVARPLRSPGSTSAVLCSPCVPQSVQPDPTSALYRLSLKGPVQAHSATPQPYLSDSTDSLPPPSSMLHGRDERLHNASPSICCFFGAQGR